MDSHNQIGRAQGYQDRSTPWEHCGNLRASASLPCGRLRVVGRRVGFQRSPDRNAGTEHLSRQLAATSVTFTKAPEVPRCQDRVIQQRLAVLQERAQPSFGLLWLPELDLARGVIRGVVGRADLQVADGLAVGNAPGAVATKRAVEQERRRAAFGRGADADHGVGGVDQPNIASRPHQPRR